MNHYYDRVTDLVLDYRGTLMKYVGDEVFAVWGAPLPSDDHPQRALECAIAIQALTPDLEQQVELVGLGIVLAELGVGTLVIIAVFVPGIEKALLIALLEPGELAG